MDQAASATRPTVNAASFLVRYLELCGIDRAYCVPGESYLPVLDAFLDSGIDLITCYHESAAGFMAVADGRLTGRPGICLASRGPGATNASIALHTAEQDGVPMLLLIGQVPAANLRRGAFQEIDYGRMFGGICKDVTEVADAARLPEALARAMRLATDGTPGPVVLVLPEDMLEHAIPAPHAAPPTATATAVPPAAVAEAARLLATAERPLILAGGALATEAGRAALLRLAETLEAPCTVTFRRHDLFPNAHRLYGGEAGLFATAAQRAEWNRADLVLAIGTRLGDIQTHGYTFPASPWPEQPLIHVYDDRRVIGRNHQPTLGVACQPAAFLQALLQALPQSAPRSAWSGAVAAHARQLSTWTRRIAPDGVAFGNVIAALRSRMPADAWIVPDAGTSAAGIYRWFPFAPPQRLLATVTGCMGFGVPGAIAYALRAGPRRVVALLGDGGFLMTAAELSTAVQRRLPIVFLLANNRALGSIRLNQEHAFPGRPSGTDLCPPDFALLAQSYDCPFRRVETEDEVGPALDAAFAHTEGPIMVEFRTSLAAILPR